MIRARVAMAELVTAAIARAAPHLNQHEQVFIRQRGLELESLHQLEDDASGQVQLVALLHC